MNTNFYSKPNIYRRMDFSEVSSLNTGDRVMIGLHTNDPDKARFVEATVTRPLFWNNDADEPDYEIETTNGFADIYSIYKAKR